ncbi:hypothetical protein J2X46_001854 [Nocardioides sp. BE266]|uniref:hypothetical protein n=1 Tax=Nocardioides sp. BE266 TaxID=2817725 RepID=UPI00285B8DCA|nr:hypothetical protein [Nocardioides sp. BE266]MDR7252869.1 hypothetical protein [Nocardioides sp. BE266]
MRSIRATAAVLLLATLTTGCSAYENFRKSDFAKQDAESIADAANTAMQDVTSMRVTGQVHPEGTQILIDLAMDEDGRCSGTMRLSQGHLAIRRIGARAWIKGDGAFVTRVSDGALPANALARLSTSWIPADDKTILRLCDLDSYLKALKLVATGGEARAGQEATYEEETTADGDRVVMLPGRAGELSWVTSEAPHRVVRVDYAGKGDKGSLAISEFNQEVLVLAPRPKDVFNP